METPEEAARRARMVARAKEWLSLVDSYRKARPNASYGWAEEQAREQDPVLYYEVHGLTGPWEESPTPKPPSVPGAERWSQPITPAPKEAQTTRTSTVPSSIVVKLTPRTPAELAALKAKVKAWDGLPGYLKDRDQRPSPTMFWVGGAKWTSVPLTKWERAIVEAGGVLPEEMTYAEAEKRTAADPRPTEVWYGEARDAAAAWRRLHPRTDGPEAA